MTAPGARIREVTAELDAARVRLLDSVSSLSDADMDFTPSTDRWTIGEILHHVRLIEDGAARVMLKLVERAEKSGVGPDPGGGSVLHSLDELRIETVVEKVIAPASVAPTRGLPPRQLLEDLAGSRDAMMKSLERCSRFDMTGLLFPHPVFGKLDAYQWALFAARHEERHRRQIEAVKSLRTGHS